MVAPHTPIEEPRSFRPRRESSAWWSDIVPLGEKAELIREIEGVRALATAAAGEISAHERECALRYAAINQDTAAMRLSIANIEATITQKTALAIKVGWTLNWKAWALAGALFSSLISALAYETGQLYGIHPVQVSKP